MTSKGEFNPENSNIESWAIFANKSSGKSDQQPQDIQGVEKINWQIVQSQYARIDKLNVLASLNPSTCLKMSRLARGFDEIERFFLVYHDAAKKHLSNETNREYAKEYAKVREKFERLIRKFVDDHGDLGHEDLKIDKIDMDVFLTSENTKLDFLVNKEIILNTVLNKALYIEQVKKFIQDNQELILKEFNISFSEDITGIQIHFVSNDETHNKGKMPVFVSFYSGEGRVFKCVCKPRSAIVDKAIISLFNEINVLHADELSPPHRLPTYTIVNEFPLSKGWKRSGSTGEISIWEHVDGKTVEELVNPSKDKHVQSRSVGRYIRSLKQSPKREMLVQKLQRMDAILTALNIGDLHWQNVMIRDLGTDNPEIIPIDLEIVEEHEGTLLSSGFKKVPVTIRSREKDLIEQLKKKFGYSIPCRLLFLGTQELGGMIGLYESSEPLARKLESYVEEKFEKQEGDLQSMFLEDTLNHDVSYLTGYEGKLYFGLIENQRIVGQKKKT
ncbi:MAG: hypothetical protein K940chlam8_00692 [Chlamydiae bacterium]|nr:hypothetical protein [Chlamydiota bacterium]